MKLSRCSGGKSQQHVEDRIGGGSLGLPPDPVLHPGKPLRGLMDVIAVGDVDDCLDQLFETFVPGGDHQGNRRFLVASRYADFGARFIDVVHPIAFPYRRHRQAISDPATPRSACGSQALAVNKL
jgi:hypothetical protein